MDSERVYFVVHLSIPGKLQKCWDKYSSKCEETVKNACWPTENPKMAGKITLPFQKFAWTWNNQENCWRRTDSKCGLAWPLISFYLFGDRKTILTLDDKNKFLLKEVGCLSVCVCVWLLVSKYLTNLGTNLVRLNK